MSLEQFRKPRLVVLGRQAMAYQAARAMGDNHIGAVLVSGPPGIAGIVTDRDLALAVLAGDLDPKTTPLAEVMSEDVVTCDIGADLDELARLMRDHGVRRIPVMENGRPVGVATFDDLVVDGTLGLDALREIVTAQLEVEAPLKPAGTMHPQARTTGESRPRALMRAKARAESTYGRVVRAVVDATGLDQDRASRALFLATCLVCRRLSMQEARHLIAQLPSLIQGELEACVTGPDRAVTAQTIEDEFVRALGLAPEEAKRVLRGVLKVVAETVSPGQIAEARGQLPRDIAALFPAAA